MEVQNGAMEDRGRSQRGGVEAQKGAVKGLPVCKPMVAD
jgi:hypothetical protein